MSDKGWILPLVLAIAIFGALMAFRTEVTSMWARALIAGVAFMILFSQIPRFGRKRG